MTEAPEAPLLIGGGPYVVGAVAMVGWGVPSLSWLTNTLDSLNPCGNTGVGCGVVGAPGSDAMWNTSTCDGTLKE